MEMCLIHVLHAKKTTHVLPNMVFACWPPMPIWWGIHTIVGESTLHQTLFEFFLGLILYIYLPKYGAFNLGLSSHIQALGL
jgi:hypothetical protein